MKKCFLKGSINSLALLPTDEIFLTQVMVNRGGIFLHASCLSWNGRGLIFAGHSGAGKSTVARILSRQSKIIAEDRVIIQAKENKFRAYSTWNNQTPATHWLYSADLSAIVFLQKSNRDRLNLISDKNEIIRRLLSCLIKPHLTEDWWDKALGIIEKVSLGMPCYLLEFRLGEDFVSLLRQI